MHFLLVPQNFRIRYYEFFVKLPDDIIGQKPSVEPQLNKLSTMRVARQARLNRTLCHPNSILQKQ